MSDRIIPNGGRTGATVLDPTLPRWRRRYFYLVEHEPPRRSFTAARAARGRPFPGPGMRIAAWWRDARERETTRRTRSAWRSSAGRPLARSEQAIRVELA